MLKLYKETCKMIGARNLLNFTRHCTNYVPIQKPATIVSPKFVSEFNTYYPKLIDTVMKKIKYMEHKEVMKRIKMVAEEYPLIKVPHQGEFLVFCYELLENPKNLNKKKIEQAKVLGAFQEIYQVYFIIEDDTLDQSATRNQKTCWYLKPEASKLAMNDNSLIRSFSFEVLKQYIEEEYYLQILDVAEAMFLNMEMSQYLDAITKDFSNFTMDVYNRTQVYKAAEYCMVAPLKMALILADKANEKSFQLVNDFCYLLGVMVQINNDYTEYLDYRKPFTKKSGNDIKEKGCTWSAVTALQHFNADQRKIFEENYGKWDDECEKRIVKLYDEVNLDKLYLEERENRYNKYLKMADNLPSDAVPSAHVFRQILNFYRSYADDLTRYYYV